jgi:ankyrin repeat protein
MLIAAGANINAADENGDTPLRWAVAAGFSDCVSLLLNAGASMEEQLLLGVQDVDTAALLLAAKADLNAVDGYGRTVCHRACNRASLLSFLVGAGADVRVKSEDGATVLHLAAAKLTEGFSDVLPRLIDAGADVNPGDNEGNCAGHVAARAGRVDNLKLLLEHGAEIERRIQEGKTMLLLAARADEHTGAIMRLLIDAGADTSVIDDSVAFDADASIFPVLRSIGVNLNCVDDDGNTPCHFADSAALVALFALGVTMTAKNLAGEMPAQLIWSSNYKNMDAKGMGELLTYTAAGLRFGCHCDYDHVAALTVAGGGHVKPGTDELGLLQREKEMWNWFMKRHKELFRARALEVCIGLQAREISVLEMCEILANMFAPMESLVPFHFAWRVVCAVKHFKKQE